MASRTTKTERFQVMLGLTTVGFLTVLAEKGTHGTSPTDVAKGLIEDGIRHEKKAAQPKLSGPSLGRKQSVTRPASGSFYVIGPAMKQRIVLPP